MNLRAKNSCLHQQEEGEILVFYLLAHGALKYGFTHEIKAW